MLLLWPSLNQENVNQAVLMDLLFHPKQSVKAHVFVCTLGGRVRCRKAQAMVLVLQVLAVSGMGRWQVLCRI